MNKLLCAVLLVAAFTSNSLHAQETEPNYPVLTIAFAAGAVISYSVYTNVKLCPLTASDDATAQSNPDIPSPDAASNCNGRLLAKDAALGAGLLCIGGFVWSLLKATGVVKYKPGALVNVSPHVTPSIRPPDFSYSAARRDVRVLLVHTTF